MSFNFQSGLGGTALAGGSLAGIGPTGGLSLNLTPLPSASQQQLGDQLALLSQLPASLFPQYNASQEHGGSLRNVGKTKSSDSRSSSAYASRHQAAEQRRRTRINERLELLRKLVPHAERANTAVFLEEVIKYIEALKCRTLELEAALEAATGKPAPKSLTLAMPTGGSAGTPEPPDSQEPSPRQTAVGTSGRQSSGKPPAAPAASGGARAASPALPPPAPLTDLPLASNGNDDSEPLPQQEQLLPPPLPLQHAHSLSQQQQQLQQLELLDLPPQRQLQLPQLQGMTAAQLSQLQQAHALFPHGSLTLGGGAGGRQLSLGGSRELSLAGGRELSLAGGSGSQLSLGGGAGQLSLGGGGSQLSLSQLSAGHGLGLPQHGSGLSLLASHHHGSHGPLGLGHGSHASHGSHGHHSHGSHHNSVAAQLSELQKLQAMQSLQAQQPARGGGGAAAPPPPFQPVNNKAFLHFNEDLFGGLKPELCHPAPCRSSLLLGGAAGGAGGGGAAGGGTNGAGGAGAPATSAATTNSLQLTSVALPADSATLLAAETGRKAQSGSPVSSEESGVPLKKRKVLLL